MTPIIRVGSILLRPPSLGDVAPLAAIWRQPSVARWWPGEGPDEIRRRIAEGEPGITPWVIELEGRVAGYVQLWEESDPEYRHAGIDLMLAEEHQGRGVGPATVEAVARWAFAQGHHRVTIDPAADNHRARRAYEKVGFRQVGVLRRYQWDPTTGSWVDGVLYDLLEDDLEGG